MDYTFQYHKLTERGKNRIRSTGEYFESHHILPKCLGGSNDKTNLCLLTAREHYIAHRLLCHIYSNDAISIRAKLASAFNMMCNENVHQRHFNSRQFEVARKNFSKNHPSRDPEVRAKISKSQQERSIIIEEYKKKHPIILPLCQCGCKTAVNHIYAKYIPGHWSTSKGFTKDIRNNLSNKKKSYIKSLTIEEKQKYLLRSCHNPNIDHKLRGMHISAAKKGKKTNQVEIMGKRFASMSDIEFNNYLTTKKTLSHNRLILYRNRYL